MAAARAVARLTVLKTHLQNGNDAPREEGDNNEKHQQKLYGSVCKMTADTRQGAGGETKIQTAVVTGAARGIGYETARQLLTHEIADCVVVTDIDAQAVNEAAKMLSREFPLPMRVVGVHGDVTSDSFAAELAAAVRATGATSIETLILNAGYTRDAVLHKMKVKDWDAMLNVHMTANFKLLKGLEQMMRGAAKREIADIGTPRPRSITIVSSTVGVHGNAGQANYSAAKSGAIGLAKTVAKEWGQFNIRCNAVAFGFVDTRLTKKPERTTIGGEEITLGIPGGVPDEVVKKTVPLRRMGTTGDAAGAIVLLSSPLASYITGQVLEVDGGVHA